MKKKHLMWSLIISGIPLACIFLYVVLCLTLPYIVVNKKSFDTSKKDIPIYIVSNGVHTDITVPITNQCKDWSETLPTTFTKSQLQNAKYISFGWGDKGFYLETPTWSDLKFKTAFNAAFYLSSSAMHITYYKNLDKENKKRKILVSEGEYRKLIHFIEGSFSKSNDGNSYLPLSNKHAYGLNDCFYEANGTYGLFYTCNTWTNNALKYSGLKACLWTPHDTGIFYHYPDMEHL